MSIIIGIDHGYYAIKTAHCSFPAGLTSYGEHEPYTRQGLLEFGGCFFVCGSGRQPIQRDKTVNDNYYLLTLAAIAKSCWLNTSRTPKEFTDSSGVLPLLIEVTASCTRTSGICLFRSERYRTGGNGLWSLPDGIPGMQHSRRW